ncbi:MAG TPA: MATE family efflux transporter [Candidatus Polarisedimenticolia bacterium]|nr:MATE family efflux transporter [Candidatus Polarisedimenticolia bacterium]
MSAPSVPSRPAPTPSAGSPSILMMAAPIVVSFVMRSAFTLVDTVYAATLGDAAVAAVGLSIPLEFLMIACWVGLSTGLTSQLSQAMGARQGARIEQVLGVTRRLVWGLVPVFTLIGLGCYVFAGRLGLEPEVAHLFAVYGSVLIGGSAFTSFWSILPDSIVKAHHDTRATMWAGIWSNVINVVLNTIFTFVFHWGVFGIALSTVVGRIGGLVYALRKAAMHENARKARHIDTDPALDPAPLGSLMSLAVPAALTYGLMAVEASVVNRLLATLPDSTSSIAAYGIYYRVVQFAVMPIIATSVAVLPFVARRFGAGDVEGVRRGLREAILAGVAYCLFLVLPAMLLFGGTIARWLAEAQRTADLTRLALWLAPLAALSHVPFQLCRPAFEGLQRGRPGLLMAVFRYVVLMVPLALLGKAVAEATGMEPLLGLIGGLIAASGLASAVFLVWMRRALRTLRPAVAAAAAAAVTPSSAADPAPVP